MSISVIYHIEAATGQFEELQAKFVANLPATSEFDGNEYVRLVAPQDDSNKLILVTQWRDADAFWAYKAWRTESGTTAMQPELVAAPAQMTMSDIAF